MDADSLLTLGLALAAVAGVVVALVIRRKAGPKKVEEMRGHLEAIGIPSSVDTADGQLAEIGHSWSEKHTGTLKLSGRSVDAINIVGVSSQYGTQYFLDFLVPVTTPGSMREKKKTKVVRKKTPALWGQTTDVEWKGDESLCRRLNFDYRLRDRLKALDDNLLRGGVTIFSERKRGCVRLRTKYFLPTREAFEVVDAVCKHVRAEW
jgi:hypothetical protein